jgi:hypothetical protein
VPRRLYHPARSRALFACRHARGKRPLIDIFEHVAEFGAVLLAECRQFVADGRMSPGHFEMMRRDVETGLRDGVIAGTTGVPRLMRKAEPPPFKRFAPILSARERLRIVLLSREDPATGEGEIGRWTRMQARTLAGGGHEVAIISEAADRHATVDFSDGVWIHRVATQANGADAPAEAPAEVKGWCGAALAEIECIKAMRGLDVVSWPSGDDAGIAAARVLRTPSVLSVHPATGSPSNGARNGASPSAHANGAVMNQIAAAPYIIATSREVLSEIERDLSVPMDRSGVAVWPPHKEAAMLPAAEGFYRYVLDRRSGLS